MHSRRIDRLVPGGPSPFVAALAIAVFGVAAGCATPEAASPGGSVPDVPAAWSTEGTTARREPSALASWWSRFDDPLLTRLVDEAMRSNLTVDAARAALRQARALRDVSAAALFPTLGLSASAQRNRGGLIGESGASNTFSTGLDANWELDIFGFNRQGLAASDQTALASAASLADVQVSIAAEVALDYIALRGSQARLGIATSNLASQQDTLQITQWREQAGLVTAVEVEQARASTESTRALLPTLRSDVERSRHALSVLTGRPPAWLEESLAANGPIPRAADDLVLSIPAETLRQRADVRAAEHQFAAAVALVAQAEAARAPSFNIGGTLGLSALGLGTLTSGGSVVSSLLAGLSVPLIDGGALRARVRVQQAALDQARSAYRAAVLTALKDVEDALTSLGGDQVRLVSLRRAAEAAANASRYARQRFSSGLIDFQVVLDTQRTQLSAQDSVATASTDLGADQVRLYKALGGGWEVDPNAPSTSAANARATAERQ